MPNVADLLEKIIPKDRIKARLIDLVAYASDAGFYYLRPKAVVLPVDTEEIKSLFHFSHQHQIPLTFRTAGTSLSGQAISDGILVDLSQHWQLVRAEDGGDKVRVQPGVIGATVNSELRRFGRKIGPDPASINSAMMGGILSNNASGMCCGVTKNSYHTLDQLKFILPNGLAYDTANLDDSKRFQIENPFLYQEILALKHRIISDENLLARIRHKYLTKNTVGYAINAFIDFEDPLLILAHLLIGAEGTLGFIAEAVLNTVPDYPLKSTALLYFPDIYAACQAIVPLSESGAEAVELMDRASLRSIEMLKGVPALIKSLPEGATALLVEYQAENLENLKIKSENFLQLAPQLSLLVPPSFTEDPNEQAFLWKVRKGMFPSVGSVRASGTTVILEDIAVPVAKLGDAILDLQALFVKYNYENAIIFGHAKDGNIHFVVTQAFETASEVERYDAFLKEVVRLVVDTYQGALKAEHGTGRNMAPFVEAEWGGELYDIMKALKHAVDPHQLLNPGVIINADPNAHLANLKDLPQVEEEVDKCMECGFCEHKCPSRNITLTPRRRIVVRRELLKLKRQKQTKPYQELLDQYQYDGLDTCAVDGLCATACPVDINTGSLVKRLRRENHSEFANHLALSVAKNFRTVSKAVGTGVSTSRFVNRLFGDNAMYNLTKVSKKVIPATPLWSNQIKNTGSLQHRAEISAKTFHTEVLYYPTCISRVMGGSLENKNNIIDTFFQVAAKAGIRLVSPQAIDKTCCGQIFSSKGFSKAYSFTVNQTIEQLWNWTEMGKLPVVMDISSCTLTLQDCRPALSDENKQRFDRMKIMDSVDFLLDLALPHLTLKEKKQKIVLHPVCSLQKMGIENKFTKLAQAFAEDVTVPQHAGCCGMAGDRGFLFPELTASATKPEAEEVKRNNYDGYYSSGKTCEMAMADAVGKNYESIVYLVDECTA